MSSYLGFKKNGTLLCWFSRNTKIYEALNNYAPCDKWGVLKLLSLDYGYDNLKEEKKGYIESIKLQRELLKRIKKSDEIMETLATIQEFKKEIKEINCALSQLSLLIDILSDGNEDDEEHPKTNKIEWFVG